MGHRASPASDNYIDSSFDNQPFIIISTTPSLHLCFTEQVSSHLIFSTGRRQRKGCDGEVEGMTVRKNTSVGPSF